MVILVPATAHRLDLKCLPWLQPSFPRAFIDKSDLSVLLHATEEICCQPALVGGGFCDVLVFVMKA